MASCFHCGLPAPPGATFCCPGCEAVSRAIVGLGCGDYYQLREAPAPRVEAKADEDLAAFDAPDVQDRFVRLEAGGTREAQLLLEGMTCAACAWLAEQAVRRLPGVVAFDVNFAARQAWLRWDAPAKLSRVLAALREVGYPAWPYDEERLAAVEGRERRGLLRRLWIAGLGMMQAMMYAVPAYVAPDGIGVDAESLMRWAGLVLTLPVVFYSASPFFAGAWREARAGRLGMDMPVALGIAAAFAASVAATLGGHGAVYFDSITMFVFFVLGGRWLERVARNRARGALQHLAKVVPQAARGLAPGDEVVVPAGATVPADGVVRQGVARVSEAWLTGESREQRREAGDRVLGGSVNAGDAFTLRVERVGADTALSGIHRMMERAITERPRWSQLADRASSWFVAGVLVASVMAFLAWSAVDPGRAAWIAISVLIVTCPCAFALATPAAMTVATGRLARANVAVTRGRAIEALAGVTDVVFDKTGTLTHGTLRLLSTRAFRGDAETALGMAASLAAWSNHPVDRALRAACATPRGTPERHRAIAGQGLEAVIDGETVRLGRATFVAGLHGLPIPDVPAGGDQGVAWLGDADGWIAAFRVGDAVRPEARDAIAGLCAAGIRVHLLTGDMKAVAERVAGTLGIACVEAGALPESKLDYVRMLQAANGRVAMVGDGLNDAPVLAQADVAIAMGGGADLAQLRADAILLSNDLRDMVTAMRVARRTRRIVRQNVAWAFAYNAIAIPLAFAGLVTPLVAAIGMSASSLLVVANALRLKA